MIKSPLQTVGGGLQYGEFVDNDFRIFGVVDNDINEDGTFNKYLFTLRGIDIYKGDFERPEDGFHIEYNFKEPFRNEANEALMRGL